MISRSGPPARNERVVRVSSRRQTLRAVARVASFVAIAVAVDIPSEGRAQVSDPPAPTTPEATRRAEGTTPPAAETAIDVTVVAPRRTRERIRDSPVAVEVIGRREIETSGARDAASVLSTQAGIQMERTFAGDGILMQGLAPQQALILIDGERLVGARDGVLDLSRMYAGDIQQIEIVRGPASAVYGSDAMAGVVNIVTRPPDAAFGLAAQGRYGATRGPTSFFRDMPQQGDAWVSATAGSEHLRTRVSAGYRHTAAIDLIPETPSTTAPEFDTYSGNARLDWLPNARFHAPLFLRVARRNATAVDENSAGGAIYDRTQRSDDLTLTSTPSLKLRRDGEAQFTVSYARQRAQYLRDQRGDDDGDQLEDSTEQLLTLRGQVHTHLVPALLLTSGVELLGQKFQSPRLLEIGERGRVSPYAELQWTFSERFHASVLPSARVDVDSQYGVNVSPRIALRVDPTERLVLRAAVGRGFRAPTFAELGLDFQNPSANYRVRGNPDLKPESSVGATVNAELDATSWLTLFVNLYHNELWDLIDSGLVEVVGGEQVFSYLNRNRARTQGVEAIVNLRFAKLVQAKLSYTLTATRDLELDRPLPGRARHRGAGQVIVGGGARPWTLSTRYQVVGKRDYYANAQTGEIATAEPTPGYATLDARAAYAVAEPLELFFTAENITNVHPRNTPLTPVTFYLGLNASY